MTPLEQSYREIPLTQGQVSLVDEEDFERVNQFKWHALWQENKRCFYAYRSIRYADGRIGALSMHRFIMGVGYGDKQEVDHKNIDQTLDNRKSNLRLATFAQNMQNRKRQRNNTSGYKGVYWHKSLSLWIAAVKLGGKRQSYSFKHILDAAQAAVLLRFLLHGDFSCSD